MTTKAESAQVGDREPHPSHPNPSRKTPLFHTEDAGKTPAACMAQPTGASKEICQEIPLTSREAERTQWEDKEKSMTELLQRVAADFDNYKKRIAKDHLQNKAMASKDIIADILPVLDGMELAISSFPPGHDGARAGMELMYAQLFSIVESRGLSVIEAQGKAFDPQFHEALLTEPGKEKNMVLEVLQKGYRLNGVVIRTSKVKISS